MISVGCHETAACQLRSHMCVVLSSRCTKRHSQGPQERARTLCRAPDNQCIKGLFYKDLLSYLNLAASQCVCLAVFCSQKNQASLTRINTRSCTTCTQYWQSQVMLLIMDFRDTMQYKNALHRKWLRYFIILIWRRKTSHCCCIFVYLLIYY